MQTQEFTDVCTLVRQLAGGALEQHHPQRVQVGSGVYRPLERAGLLRRGVREGTDNGVRLKVAAPTSESAGQPEVDQPRLAVGRDEDVRGLDVPMHQSDPMGGGQGLGNLDTHLDDTLLWQPSLGDQTRQVDALDEIHDQVRPAIDDTNLVYRR